MFGRIIRIEDKKVIVENLKNEILSNLIGYHVVFEDTKKMVGEIVYVDKKEFHINLIGEIVNNNLIPGVMKYPLGTATTRIVYKNELELIIGSQEVNIPKNLLLGKSNVYDQFVVSVNTSDFFSNHFAIIGNTGSGKSCGVARLIQNLFSEAKTNPNNSHIIIFDTYGEYQSALTKINTHPGINTKQYTTSLKELNNNTEIIKIPPYLLEVDDLALLLNINDSGLIPVLEKTLSYVYIFKSNDDICKKYKNDIIAKCFLDLLSSGKPPQQIRDQVIAFLSKYNTDEINLETIISQPGLNRTIRQCLNIDPQGKMLALELLVTFLKKYSEVNIDNIMKTPTEYTLDDLYYAMEFAIVSEGAFNNNAIYEKVNQLKTRLHSFINGEYKQYFEYSGFISLENYVNKLFMTSDSENAQIVDVNFNYIDDRLAKNLVKIFSKMFYKYTVNLEDRGSYPINIIIEEAHRYIQKDNDIEILGYNIFDRIAKEGRKYGLLLGLITQRISELSSTVLSQCSNFIIFRMYYPEDIKIVSSIASNVTMDAIEKLKSLTQGMALVFGISFKIPLITYFAIPNPMPTSTSVNINEKWYQ